MIFSAQITDVRGIDELLLATVVQNSFIDLRRIPLIVCASAQNVLLNVTANTYIIAHVT